MRKVMRKVIWCIKTAILSDAASLLVFISLLYGGVEILDAFFWTILIFSGIYFGILSATEQKNH